MDEKLLRMPGISLHASMSAQEEKLDAIITLLERITHALELNESKERCGGLERLKAMAGSRANGDGS